MFLSRHQLASRFVPKNILAKDVATYDSRKTFRESVRAARTSASSILAGGHEDVGAPVEVLDRPLPDVDSKEQENVRFVGVSHSRLSDLGLIGNAFDSMHEHFVSRVVFHGLSEEELSRADMIPSEFVTVRNLIEENQGWSNRVLEWSSNVGDDLREKMAAMGKLFFLNVGV